MLELSVCIFIIYRNTTLHDLAFTDKADMSDSVYSRL